jgi:iron-sulfur cluster repair protein YtfE (RIC family)
MVDTQGFRTAHDELDVTCAAIRDAARRLPALPAGERAEARDEVLRLLGDVEGHMKLDEQVLFPQVAERLSDPLATASMSYDHRAIRQWLREIHDAPLDPPDELQRLLYGLDALIRVHMWKENELYLAMLDSPGWPAA